MASVFEVLEEGTDVRGNGTDWQPREKIYGPSADTTLSAPDFVRGKVKTESIIGLFVGWSASGNPLVDFPDNRSLKPVPARTTVALRESDLNRDVILLFTENDPIVIGVLQPAKVVEAGVATVDGRIDKAVRVEADGQRLVLTAEKEIVLTCGAATITLTCAGKILIRGSYLVSRASGTNRIKGGSVQIN